MSLKMKAPRHLHPTLDRDDRRALADLAGVVVAYALIGLAAALSLLALTLLLALCVRLFILVVGA